ncbi:hypothetical protein Rs2_02559 [Raphanus sativus]|nr:hypothetical protein Rs2_02559 [Raphanus sativus]
MEICWQIHRPASVRPVLHQKGRLKINTCIGLLHPRPKSCSFSSLASLESQYNSNGFLHQITARAADLSRKKQGRMAASGPKSSAPTTVGSSQKRTPKKKSVEKDSNATSTVTNEILRVSKLPEAKADVEKQSSVVFSERNVLVSDHFLA